MNPMTYLSSFLIFTAIGFLYFGTFVRMSNNLFTPQNSHGWLILLVSLYLIWKKRGVLRCLPAQPNLLFGSLFTIFGCFIFLSGKLSSTYLLQQISLIITLWGLIYLTLGYRFFKTLLVPIGYILFMFGFFEEIFGNVSIHLQTLSAWISFNLLKLTGWPLLLKGHVIELPHIRLEVARACNGINHITALIALAVPLAVITQKTFTKKIALILTAFIIGIFANGLRVALIGIWSFFNKGGSLHGPFDTLYVSFIFFLGMILLVGFSRITTKPLRIKKKLKVKILRFEERLPNSNNTAIPKEILPPTSNLQPPTPLTQINPNSSINPTNPTNPINPSTSRLFASFIGMLILLSTISFSYFYKPKLVFLAKPLNEFPMRIGDWIGKDVSDLNTDILKEFSADVELKRFYQNHTGTTIKLYIGYFPAQEKEKKVIDHRLGWLHDNPETIRIPVAGKEILIKKSIRRSKNTTETVYFWYNQNGRIILNPYISKMATALDAFINRKTNGAITLMIVEHTLRDKHNEFLKFLQEVLPLIQIHLKNNK